ncbi:unnamed protein product [Effrenium voratum]|nr:unnamed protein product [Effrenium voratum]
MSWGRGCHQLLVSKAGFGAREAGYHRGFHQEPRSEFLRSEPLGFSMDPRAHLREDLAGWGDSPSKFRSLLRQAAKDVALPGAEDLVIYFRPFKKAQVQRYRLIMTRRGKTREIFDIHMKNVRLSSPPLDFFRFAVDSAQVRQKGAKIWAACLIVESATFTWKLKHHPRNFAVGASKLDWLLEEVLTDPSLRQHPTVQRIQRELGAELFVAMDKVGKQCWLADWLWMKAAKRLAIAPSTFAWWAAFLGQAEDGTRQPEIASEVYLPIMPGEALVPMPWCRLFPDDTRFLPLASASEPFHDLWKNTSYHEASAAKNICLEYFDCPQKQCPLQQRPEEVAALFPELLALRHPQDVEYLNASGGKRLPVPSAADGTRVFECPGPSLALRGELPPAERLGVAEAATPVPAPAATPAPAPVTVKPAPTELPATGDAAVLRRHAGLYVDKARSLEFKDIVLLTVANAAYMDFLRNWECHAHRLGLDWVVLALDDEAWEKAVAGRRGALRASGNSSSGALEYLNKGFNLMSMNTLAAVFDVMDKGFDVVFTDSDNVFLSDPFAAGVSFGERIRTGRYDYIYQLNWPGPRPYQPGAEIHEGNTGFYFASLRRKPEPTRTLWQAVLKACSRNPQLDGQPNFWNALRGLRQERKPCFRVCQEQQMCNGTAEAEILDYCEMDPFRHRTGWGKRDKDGPVSYHANFKVGRASKISALKGMGLWRPTEEAWCAG